MPAVVDKEKCSACGDCVDACPSQAISVPEKTAEIKKDECIDCNACVDTCPNQAISME